MNLYLIDLLLDPFVTLAEAERTTLRQSGGDGVGVGGVLYPARISPSTGYVPSKSVRNPEASRVASTGRVSGDSSS